MLSKIINRVFRKKTANQLTDLCPINPADLTPCHVMAKEEIAKSRESLENLASKLKVGIETMDQVSNTCLEQIAFYTDLYNKSQSRKIEYTTYLQNAESMLNLVSTFGGKHDE